MIYHIMQCDKDLNRISAFFAKQQHFLHSLHLLLLFLCYTIDIILAIAKLLLIIYFNRSYTFCGMPCLLFLRFKTELLNFPERRILLNFRVRQRLTQFPAMSDTGKTSGTSFLVCLNGCFHTVDISRRALNSLHRNKLSLCYVLKQSCHGGTLCSNTHVRQTRNPLQKSFTVRTFRRIVCNLWRT